MDIGARAKRANFIERNMHASILSLLFGMQTLSFGRSALFLSARLNLLIVFFFRFLPNLDLSVVVVAVAANKSTGAATARFAIHFNGRNAHAH